MSTTTAAAVPPPKPTVPETGEERDLRHVETIEKLGGAAGYKKWLEEKKASESSPKAATPEVLHEEFSSAVVTVESSFVHSTFKIVSAGHSVTIHAYGAGTAGSFKGLLHHDSWEELVKAPVDYVLVAAGWSKGGVVVTFSRNGKQVGQAAVVGQYRGVAGGKGQATWAKV